MFCTTCERQMERVTESGSVVYKCYCGETSEGSGSDAWVMGASLNSAQLKDLNQCQIRNAPFDRVNQTALRHCERCNLDYMTRVRLGDQEHVYWRCKCSNIVEED